MTRKCLITGASRGIGLELTRQLLENGDSVVATARNPHGSDGLKALGQRFGDRLQLATLDVLDAGSIGRVAGIANKGSLDLVINNAGILIDDTMNLGTVSPDALMASYATNAVAPLMLTRALLPALRGGRAPAVAFLTSKMGSIADNTSGGYYAYRSSKSALNMLVKSMAIELAPAGIRCILLHPGWVRTEMGGPNAVLDVESSVRGLLAVIGRTTPAETGGFFDYTGKKLPW